MKKEVFVATIFIAFIAVSGCGDNNQSIAPKSSNEILIPGGYVFIGASAYGVYINDVTFYLQHQETGRFYEFKEGKIGRAITLPEDYVLIGASAHGQYVNSVTFYCRLRGSDKILKFKP